MKGISNMLGASRLLALVAVICFVLAAVGVHTGVDLTDVGLAFLAGSIVA